MGWPNVDALLESMTSRQLAEWMAYYQVEPFGSEFLDVHLAQLAAVMVNKDRTRSKQIRVDRFRLIKSQAEAWNPAEWFRGMKRAIKWAKGK